MVDGASTDSTLALVRAHQLDSMKLISEPDHGIYDAMNKGVAAATGEVVCFLNADDLYADTGVLARIAMRMDQERLDALFGDVAYFHSSSPQQIIRHYSSRHFRPDRIGWGWMPAHPALFLRRAVYERFGLFRTDYRIAGDFEFVARVFHGDTLNYRHEPEVMVRMRTGGISTGGWRNTLLLNREVLRACKENGIRTSLPRILSKYPAKLLEFLRR